MRLFIVLAVLFVSTSAFADSVRRDGNWWWAQQGSAFETVKVAYVLGVFDGISVGRKRARFDDDFVSYGGRAIKRHHQKMQINR